MWARGGGTGVSLLWIAIAIWMVIFFFNGPVGFGSVDICA
jgi:hypothetical protein